MYHLPLDLYKQCRNLLLKCNEFESDSSLSSIFIISELAQYQNALPVATNIGDRVDKILAFLLQKQSRNNTPLLLVFLELLRDRRYVNDDLFSELTIFINMVQSYFGALEITNASPMISESREPAALQFVEKRDWDGAIDPGILYGRDEEILILKTLLVKDRTRLVTVLGMGGIGKTSLAVMLAREVQDSFDYLFWRDLRNAPSVEEIAKDCIMHLSEQKLSDFPGDIDNLLDVLVGLLRSKNCLLILDNFESILSSTLYIYKLIADSRKQVLDLWCRE